MRKYSQLHAHKGTMRTRLHIVVMQHCRHLESTDVQPDMVWPLCSASSWRSKGSTGHRWMVCEARFTKMKELSGESAMLMMGALSTTVTATCQSIYLHQHMPWTCWYGFRDACVA